MTTTKTKTLLVSGFFFCIAFAGWGQVPLNYKVQPTTKLYKKLQNPLIKSVQPIEVLVVKGEAYLEGDIYLGKVADLDRIQNTMQGLSVTTDNNIISARWDNGTIPFVILDGFTDVETQTIINAMNHIAERTNVCFRRRTNQLNYIKFKKYTADELGFEGGSSYLGKCTFCLDGQEIKLSVVSNRVVRHELGHALGLLHEQNREDRNNSVQILTENIQPIFANQFNQSIYTSSDVGSYDFNSIMHYFSNAFGKEVNGRSLQTIRRISNPSDVSFGRASVLSNIDVQGINSMYPVAQNCATLSMLLPGELEIGDSKTISVSAKQLHNTTGIFLRAGQKFEFTTTNRDWNNGSKTTDCNGYAATLLDAGRRHGDLNMMTLVGEVFTGNNTSSYSGTYFKIGCSRTWTATKSGFLICIANDNVLFYGDNSGSVSLTIKRVE